MRRSQRQKRYSPLNAANFEMFTLLIERMVVKNSEILQILLLDALEYDESPTKVKAYLKASVNNTIDNCEWCDGFEIAVKSGDLDHYEYTELLDAINAGFPTVQLDKEHIVSAIDKCLPSFFRCMDQYQ